MLEVFNGVIQNSMTENPTLIYDIVSSHKAFEDLGSFTLVSGLREVKRRELAKEELAKRRSSSASDTSPPKSKGKSPASGADTADPVAEKALLLQNESWNRAGSMEGGEDAAPGSPRDSGAYEYDYEDDGASGAGPASPLSEKARGKLRERVQRSRPSVDMSSISLNLDQLALSVGRNGFVPTQDWVTSWQQGLPLDPILIVISELLPKVQGIQARQSANSLNFVLDFIAHASLKDVLPPVPPLNPRKFSWSDASIAWLTSLLWGEVYVRGMSPLGIWNGTNVRLFHVKHATPQPRQITETVSNVVGGLLRRRTSDAPPVRSRLG